MKAVLSFVFCSALCIVSTCSAAFVPAVQHPLVFEKENETQIVSNEVAPTLNTLLGGSPFTYCDESFGQTSFQIESVNVDIPPLKLGT